MLQFFISHIFSSIFGLWLTDRWLEGVVFNGPFFIFPKSPDEFFNTLIFTGICLGFLNFFIKPILKKITLPLRIITFNLFTLVLAMIMVWIIDVVFRELEIKGIIPLFWTTIIVTGLTFITAKISLNLFKNKKTDR